MNSRVTNLQGDYGRTFIGPGSSGTAGVIYKTFVPIEATVFTTLTDDTCDGDDPTAVEHPAGVPIYGQFTAITVDTGSGYAYKDRPI